MRRLRQLIHEAEAKLLLARELASEQGRTDMDGSLTQAVYWTRNALEEEAKGQEGDA